MGRKTKPLDECYSETIKFRAPAGTKAALKKRAKAANMTVSSYARAALDGATPLVKRKRGTQPPPKRIDPETRLQIRMLGVNVHGILKQMRFYKKEPPKNLEPLLAEIRAKLEEV